ncbi:MAG: RNA-binding S4 domain-containing protein [Muribaculaceae bacterium]|nr:RNA-binding S4 domain-containing protein [Muribaculaceae bacterium]
MEEAKKPKRPRIGSAGMNSSSDTGENDARYEKVNYPSDSMRTNNNEGTTEQGHTNYQQRNYGYNQNRGGYNQNRQQGYGQQGGYNRNQGGYNQNRQQGYGQQGGYNRNQGGYNQNRNQGGYNRNQGGYNQNRQQNYGQTSQEGGYTQHSQEGGYTQNRQQGGYNQNRNQGGYGQNRQQGGYNQNRQQGGYSQNRNQGGYGQNRQQGGYGQNRNQGGFNRNNNRNQGGFNRNQGGMKFTPRPKQVDYVLEDIDPNEQIRLNKYMANAGICSRREADEYITGGKVKVNGEVVTELGTKISRDDVVEFDEKVVTPERKCYVLLNKPKDCVTTSDDPNGRTTVLDIVKNACRERIYPVGRLDRNTTGVLLLTNDGDLASKLTHPKYVKKKIYHVWTDRDIAEEDMQRIADGIELEDGEIHADAISYVSDTDRNQAGIEIHSGRNRIVRRIFESLGYRVTKLDRVYFAGLTKKNLPRGRWRYLTQEEVNYLRMGSFE